MGQIKAILRLIFIKYWFLFALLVFAIVVKFGYQEYQSRTAPPQYYARLFAATSVISENTLNQYLDPVAKSIMNKEYVQASNLLKLSIEDLKTIKSLFSKSNMIIAEKDVRYELIIFADFNDTTKLSKIENSLINYITANTILQRDYNAKRILFNNEQRILDSEIRKVDSLITVETNKKSPYVVSLLGRRTDLELQKVQSQEKFNRYYEIEKIQSFRDTLIVKQTYNSVTMLEVLNFLAVGLLIEFLIILFVDKNLLGEIKKKLMS